MVRSDFYWLIGMMYLLMTQQASVLSKMDRLLGDKRSSVRNMYWTLLWASFTLVFVVAMFYSMYTEGRK